MENYNLVISVQNNGPKNPIRNNTMNDGISHKKDDNKPSHQYRAQNKERDKKEVEDNNELLTRLMNG